MAVLAESMADWADRTSALLAGSSFTALPSCVDLRLSWAFLIATTALAFVCASLARLVVCVLAAFAKAVSAEATACASFVAVAVALFCALCNDSWRLVRLPVGPETVMACAADATEALAEVALSAALAFALSTATWAWSTEDW